MVYLLASWGMGENDTCNKNNVQPDSHTSFQCPEQQIGNDEINLLPLSNQVHFIILIHGFYSYITRIYSNYPVDILSLNMTC